MKNPTPCKHCGAFHGLDWSGGLDSDCVKAAASGAAVASQRRQGCDDSSLTLFDDSPDWRNEWQGMPEFVQERKREYAKIIVRFRSQEDLEEFAALIGQRLNRRSQCTWHPELQRGELQPKVKYVAKS